MTIKMNDFTIDKDFFEKTIPAAKQPDEQIWNDMQMPIQEATDVSETRFVGSVDITGYPEIITAVKQYICYTAMYNSVNERDLILTNNGFGIVSNQNIAPASKERVEAFKDSMQRSADRAIERAIDALRAVNEWSETIQAKTVIDKVMFYSWHLSSFAGIVKPTRQTLAQYTPQIMEAQTCIARLISNEQLYAVIESMRTTSTDAAYQNLHVLMLKFVGGFIAKLNEFSMRRLRDDIYNYVESNLESFPVYKDSAAYRANHFKPYENKKEDTTYFFG